MIIALPATDHDHLADALVRDLGFTRTHVDQPIRDLLLAMNPVVDRGGIQMANRGPGPDLASQLELRGGWDRLLSPPRPTAQGDRVSAEVKRLLDVLRTKVPNLGAFNASDDLVIVGVPVRDAIGPVLDVAIDGRNDIVEPDHWIPAGGVVAEQRAIVAYVQEKREAKVVPDLAPWVGGPGTLQITGNNLASSQVTPDDAGSAHTALDSGSET